MAQKLGLSSELTELKIGKSFMKNRGMGFHSARYDFKPASVDPSQVAEVDIGDNNDVRVTVPHIEGSGKSETVFQGSKKPYQKECVLIIDHVTGEITLEKLSYNIQLKKTRSEGGGKRYGQRPVTPVETLTTNHKPPNVTMKNSPSQRVIPSPNEATRISPNRTLSPAQPQKSPSNVTASPKQFLNQSSPSMPVILGRPTPSASNQSSSMNYRQRKPNSPIKSNMPTFSQLVNDSQNNVEEVGVLSDSSSSDNDNASSDSESEPELPFKNSSVLKAPEGLKPSIITSNMPQLSQLSEDLQLSESDSD